MPLDDIEFLFWGAIDTGLITYTEASDMTIEELAHVFRASVFIKQLKAKSITDSFKDMGGVK